MVDTFHISYKYIRKLLSNYGKNHKVDKSFLAITTICYTTEYINKIQIKNNNKILLSYMINIFHLYYKYIRKLLSTYGKIHGDYKSFLTITIICYIKEYTNKFQINNNNKILLLYI